MSKNYADILSYDQIQKFKSFGVIDYTQNWLELFTPTRVQDLFTIKDCCSDNPRKSDYISEELKPLGFEDLGLGTNILTMTNPYYPGVVFKIALDDCGIADNYNDCILQHYVPHYNKVLALLPSAIVSVQPRYVIMNQEQRELFMPQILDLLRWLSKRYLVADLSPSRFLNYAISREGDFVIIDGSDLYPLSQMEKRDIELRCTALTSKVDKKTGRSKRCEGKLMYSEDYLYLVCQKCGREFEPIEFRPGKDVNFMLNIMLDGMTEAERQYLNTAMRPPVSENVDVTDDDEDIEEEQEEVLVPEYAFLHDPVLDDTVSLEDEDDTDEALEAMQELLSTMSDAISDDTRVFQSMFQKFLNDLPERFQSVVANCMNRTTIVETVTETKVEIVTEDESPINSNIPYSDRIDYKIIPETGDDTKIPGIYLEIHGDFDEAYDESALPLYVKSPDSETLIMAVSASSIYPSIKTAYDILQEELELVKNSSDDRDILYTSGMNDDSDEDQNE